MNIIVLAGGTSTERKISIISGHMVCRALIENGHKAILVDVFTGNRLIDPADPFKADYDLEASVKEIESFNDRIEVMVNDPARDFFGANVIDLCRKADIVFMALHGSNGEDGRLQAAFDLMNIRYTGSGYLGCAMAMSKDIAKHMLSKNGVPVPRGIYFMADEPVPDIEKSGLSYPVVVKPNCGGSSVGVSIVNTDEEYKEALKISFALEDEVVVEEYVKGREFSVGVIDGKALPVIELAPISGFYDYKNKYTAGSTVETCPAKLSEEQRMEMQKYAVEGYRALALDAYARLDFLMNEEGRMFCLEANPLPGMTPTSLMPQEAAKEGMDFNALCDELIRVSLEKYD